MLWYIREEGWYYSKIHGPFDSREEAEQKCPRNVVNGRPEAQVHYKIFETGDLLVCP